MSSERLTDVLCAYRGLHTFDFDHYLLFDSGRCLRLRESGLAPVPAPRKPSVAASFRKVLGARLREILVERHKVTVRFSNGAALRLQPISGTPEPGHELVLIDDPGPQS